MHLRWIHLVGAVLLLGLQSQAFEPAGSKIQGMGGAGAAVPFEVTTVYWNPAGLYLQNRMGMDFTFSFEEVEWPQNWGFSYLNYSPTNRTGKGLGIYRIMDNSGPEGGDAVSVLLSTVYKTPIGLPIGLSVKYINESWADEGRKSHWSGDLGVVIPYGGWLLGLCVQSISDPNSHLNPFRILAGLSWRIGEILTFAAQVSALDWDDFEEIDQMELRTGVDLGLSRTFSVQGGWVRTATEVYWTGGAGLFHQRRARLSAAYHWYPDGERDDRFYLSYGYFMQ
jgi:hypothetical protein